MSVDQLREETSEVYGKQTPYRSSVDTGNGEGARRRCVSLFIMLLESAFTRVTVQGVLGRGDKLKHSVP